MTADRGYLPRCQGIITMPEQNQHKQYDCSKMSDFEELIAKVSDKLLARLSWFTTSIGKHT